MGLRRKGAERKAERKAARRVKGELMVLSPMASNPNKKEVVKMARKKGGKRGKKGGK